MTIHGLYLKMQCPDGQPGGYVPFSLRALFGLPRLGYRLRLVTYAHIKRAAEQYRTNPPKPLAPATSGEE